MTLTHGCVHLVSFVFVAAGSVPVCVACSQEECKGWDVSSIVFSPALWLTYQSIMRADFKLFDQYEYTPQGILHPVSLSLTEAHPAVEMRHIKLCDGLLSVGCRLPLCTQRLKCERGCCMLVCRRAFCIPCQHVSRDQRQASDQGHGRKLAAVYNRAFQLCSDRGHPSVAFGQDCQDDLAASYCGSALWCQLMQIIMQCQLVQHWREWNTKCSMQAVGRGHCC